MRGGAGAGDLLEDVVRALGPYEWLGLAVVDTNVVVKGQFKIGDTRESAATYAADH
jgi:hypothetical protein